VDDAISWDDAHELAGRFPALESISLPLDAALGHVLAADIAARTDLPPFTTSAMDGWAVSGPAPWQVVADIPAGADESHTLASGQAALISTGARVPAGAEAVLRREAGIANDVGLEPIERAPAPGEDMRAAGSECRKGDIVAPAGLQVSPAVAGLAAAVGADGLVVVRRPDTDLFVLGDELLAEGTPRLTRIRDALGPMVAPWLARLGADVRDMRRLTDSARALRDAVSGSDADLLVTTGSTARGTHDHVHDVIRELGAELVVDGVAVRPGHPMVLARLPDGRPWVCLPGNPLAAVSALVTLAEPVLRALRGAAPARVITTRLNHDVAGHPTRARLLPVLDGVVLHYIGPAMLRGLAQAEGLALVPAGGVDAGEPVRLLPLPD
jgi:molybdopterin molybdotransferase